MHSPHITHMHNTNITHHIQITMCAPHISHIPHTDNTHTSPNTPLIKLLIYALIILSQVQLFYPDSEALK